ncbi:MAG: UDP-N-acetylmuramoyl-tripeptide--D-alanyl-D-alanine ligase [Candidatus Wildermuthbacteria bacterium]|nr:UDP-N-acetylmuramoyl-tripeptide--D-alanyl-D-alanine ligase [Candidatus Wildermuthbacteria bacterium]
MILFFIPWLLHTAKSISFWLYLWQLKNYHIGRFIDHFRTEQGKRLFLNPSVFAKLALIASAFLLPFAAGILDPSGKEKIALFLFLCWLAAFLGVYLLETVLLFRRMLKGALLLPVPTKKIVLLRLAVTALTLVFLVFVLFGYLLPAWKLRINPFVAVLAYDLLLPFIVSLIVLLFQPIFVLGRNRIVKQAKQKRMRFPALKVVGITGSFGKTSTKEFLSFILSGKFKVLKTREHQNSEIGISQCILNELDESYQVFVCEMGAYGKGGIALLAGIAKPSVGIVTGANEQHLATFGSMENLLSAEGGRELVDALPEDGIAIFNGSNIHAKNLYIQTSLKKKVLCGMGEGMDISAHSVKVEQEKVSFFARTRKGEQEFAEAPLAGGHNIDNLLLAIAGAKALGMQLSEIAQRIREMPQELGTMKIYKAKEGFAVVDSTYSANPDGVLSALEYLKIWPGKKILVMPCLIELGASSKDVHRRLGVKIREVCDLAIITSKEHFEDIRAGSSKIVFMRNPQEILEKIIREARAGDAVLLEGRGPLRAQDF